MNYKRALVLCGGGARGGYHIGIWRALKEINYYPDIITGTSVGALNGALFTLKEDDLAVEIWENMSMDTVFEAKENKNINAINSVNEFILSLGELGGIDPKPLKKLVAKLADEKKFREESDIEFGLVTTALNPIIKVEKYIDEMEEGKIVDYILASSACFPIMQKYQIGDTEYVDGGYSDNIPFELALKRGAKELVIVDMPGMFKLKKIEDINAKVHYIYPNQDLGNFLLFNKETSRKNMKLGYLDTMKVFDMLEGQYYTFEKGAHIEADKYNEKCKSVYRKIFTNLPSIGTWEKIATDKLLNYIKNYNKRIFEEKSNVLDILEIAAQEYDIDYTKIYSFDELIRLILEKYDKSVESEQYKEILSMSKIKESIGSLEELKKLIKSYDKGNIIAYLVYLLTLEEITLVQKRQILAITTVMPNYVCSAIMIAGYKNK